MQVTASFIISTSRFRYRYIKWTFVSRKHEFTSADVNGMKYARKARTCNNYCNSIECYLPQRSVS